MHQLPILMHLLMLLIFKAIGYGESFITIKVMLFQQYPVVNWMQKTNSFCCRNEKEQDRSRQPRDRQGHRGQPLGCGQSGQLVKITPGIPTKYLQTYND